MLSTEINPYVRRAFILKRRPFNKIVKNADCRLFYILEGSGELIIDGKTYEIESDYLGLWKSNTEYCWNFNSQKKCVMAIINFDYTQDFTHKTKQLSLIPESKFSSTKIHTYEDFDDIEILNKPVILKNMHILKKDILEIIEECEKQLLYSQNAANTLLNHIIIKIARTANTRIVSNERLKIEPILEYIQNNYQDEITNISLGKMINYHPHYINSLMKKYTGTTLHSYLTEYRMTESLKFITNTDLSIEEIALRVGYKNPTHFCSNFKKRFGISPSKYRHTSNII